jgi:hypothetical protein
VAPGVTGRSGVHRRSEDTHREILIRRSQDRSQGDQEITEDQENITISEVRSSQVLRAFAIRSFPGSFRALLGKCPLVVSPISL